MSSYGVMRGLHFQKPPFIQSKLVRCVKGRVIIIPSFFVDKASCTRQFESEFSLHSLASLFPIKEGSTSHLGLLPSGKKRETALRCSEPLRSKVGGPKRSSPCCAGWDRLGIAVYSLQLIVYDWFRGYLLITCRFLVNCLVVSRKKRTFAAELNV